MSTVVDNTSPGGAVGFLSRSDLLNVSITRARRRHVLFLSRDPEKFDQLSLFGQYVNWVLQGFKTNYSGETKKVNSEIQNLYQSLSSEMDIEAVEFDVEIGKLKIDILIFSKHGQLALDLIGFKNTANQHSLSTEAYAMLSRAGLKCIPVAHNEWNTQREQLLRQIKQHSDPGGHHRLE